MTSTPFFTTKEVGSGTGLGLSVTYSIVEQHQGTIAVESVANEGTKFRVVLPLEISTAKTKAVTKTLTEQAVSASSINKFSEKPKSFNLASPDVSIPEKPDNYQIFIIDDDPTMLRCTKIMVSAKNHDISCFDNGEEALAYIEENGAPDVILCDIIMPGINGIELCKKIRQIYTQVELPIILITGSVGDKEKISGFESGANDYVVKPFEKEELRARVKTQLNVLDINKELITTKRQIEEINQGLEKEVRKRTTETNSALSKLESQHKQLREQHQTLQKMQSQLIHTEKMSSLGTLVAGIAHELNNPINFIYSGSQSLDNEIRSLEEYFFSVVTDGAPEEILAPFKTSFNDIKLNMEGIAKGAARARGIITNLHHISRTNNSNQPVPFDLVEGLESTLNLIRVNFKEKINFKLDLSDSPPLMGVPTKLNQVYMNIIVNSCHALLDKLEERPFGFNPEIKIATKLNNEYVQISIADNGPGIPDEVIPKIFEPFYTTKSEGKGTGLGLAISYSIIQDHGGDISVTSSPGEGATFTLKLPLAKPEQ